MMFTASIPLVVVGVGAITMTIIATSIYAHIALLRISCEHHVHDDDTIFDNMVHDDVHSATGMTRFLRQTSANLHKYSLVNRGGDLYGYYIE